MYDITILIALLTAIVCLIITCVHFIVQNRKIRTKYSKIIDVDKEIEMAKTAQIEFEKDVRSKIKKAEDDSIAERQKIGKEVEDKKNELLQFNKDYCNYRKIYEQLTVEVKLLEENLENISYGLYKPHYSFDSSEKYKEALMRNYEEQKQLIKSERAANCSLEWKVGDSRAEGKKMTKQYMKVILRAFNGECDAAIAKVNWNNVSKMIERINKAYEAINKTGEVMKMSITSEYLHLKLAELQLTYEEEQKKHEEIEEQRKIKEQMREEEKAMREAEKAERDAENEEAKYEKALVKAKEEAQKATGDKISQMNEKILELEYKLEEANRLKERAKSLAEQTKSGHVYVISNIGSFGKDVFKIGMTRRLEPMDRVRELGDASVPFEFDVHAMIYSTNAPGLENTFHRCFDGKRVNMVNPRKEFFNISIDEIEKFAKDNNMELRLTKLAEAREFRQTINLKEKGYNQSEKPTGSSGIEPFPTNLL